MVVVEEFFGFLLGVLVVIGELGGIGAPSSGWMNGGVSHVLRRELLLRERERGS
jgi:hypothetical protein